MSDNPKQSVSPKVIFSVRIGPDNTYNLMVEKVLPYDRIVLIKVVLRLLVYRLAIIWKVALFRTNYQLNQTLPDSIAMTNY
eukprot:scaffold17413_cov55-Cyclotella_meneghiniana.AAC.8